MWGRIRPRPTPTVDRIAPPSHLRDGIRLTGVSFSYDPERVALRDVNLHLPAGSTIALVGAVMPYLEKADPNVPGQVGAPIPGVVSTIAIELNQRVAKGDRLLVMEAMKMQSTVYSPVAGSVKQLLVGPGAHVEAKDLLLAIE